MPQERQELTALFVVCMQVMCAHVQLCVTISKCTESEIVVSFAFDVVVVWSPEIDAKRILQKGVLNVQKLQQL